MIFKNLDFHNIDHMEETEDGYKLVRVPEKLRLSLNDGAKNGTAYYATGAEIRFVMKGENAKLILRSEESKEAQVAYIIFGSVPGGWDYSRKIIYTHDTVIDIKRPVGKMLELLYKNNDYPFDSEVVRVVLPFNKITFVDVIGDVCPPKREQTPKLRYLADGSSITHGSNALTPVTSYAFQTAENLGADLFNLGFAGSAHLEKEMAEWIVSRDDWDFATAEMGINLVDVIEADEFYKRASAFLDVLAKDKRTVYCTDMFTAGSDITNPEKMQKFRAIIRELTEGRFPYICGTELMTSTAGLSADFVHPNIRGVNEIAQNLTKFIKDWSK